MTEYFHSEMVLIILLVTYARYVCPIHTADAAATQPSAVVTQFTISCAVQLLRLVTSDVIMTSLLKKNYQNRLKFT